MSRYIKDVSAINYRYKKFFSQTGLYSVYIPASSKVLKTMVFGGGGNSCTTTICNCRVTLSQCCCCCWVRGHFSGAGGGFSEKLWFGQGGQLACICVAGSEGTSWLCVANVGCHSATGGTGSGTCTRTMTAGCGIGGDVNTCGNVGYCRCTSGFCRYDCLAVMCCPSTCPAMFTSLCGCYYEEVMGVHLPGGTPGDSICTKANLSDNTNVSVRCCCFAIQSSQATGNNNGDSPSEYYYMNGYMCRKYDCYQGDHIRSCTYNTVPGYCWGFPSWYCATCTALEATGQYAYDWDPLGNCCCTCIRSTCSGVSSYSSCSGSQLNCCAGPNVPYYCCYFACYCFVNRSNESCTHTALGAPGFGCAPGTIGGGGAGIWNGDPTRSLTDYSKSGGVGLVVLHY